MSYNFSQARTRGRGHSRQWAARFSSLLLVSHLGGFPPPLPAQEAVPFRLMMADSSIVIGAVVTMITTKTVVRLDSIIRPAPKPVPPVARGIPFGPYNLFGGGGAGTHSWDTPLVTAPFTMGTDLISPEGLERRLTAARVRGIRQVIQMTGGSHARYKTDGVFDMEEWRGAMDRYNTPAIKAAVARGVEDGSIIGNSVMDEPHNAGTVGHLKNSWGPAGTMTKARIDSMCTYQKGMFPTLPCGVVHDHAVFEPDKSYRVVDFVVDQYAWVKTQGDVLKFRNDALAMSKRDGHAVLFSINILAGGEHKWPKDPWVCPEPPETFQSTGKNPLSLGSTGGRGPFAPTCRVTPAQLLSWGTTLGAAGCGLTMWRYDRSLMAKPEYQASLGGIAATLAVLPAVACKRVSG